MWLPAVVTGCIPGLTDPSILRIQYLALPVERSRVTGHIDFDVHMNVDVHMIGNAVDSKGGLVNLEPLLRNLRWSAVIDNTTVLISMG